MKSAIRYLIIATLAIQNLAVGGRVFAAPQGRARGVTAAQVEQLLRRVNTRWSSFRLDLNRTSFRRDNDFSERLNAFERATSNLLERVRTRTDTSADAADVLSQATAIDGVLRSQRLSATAEGNWSLLRSDFGQLASYYNLSWDSGTYSRDQRRRPQQNSGLNGTFQLDQSQSENIAAVANRATRGLSPQVRDRVRSMIERRLEPPDVLALERSGRNVTIASSRAPRVTVDADGRPRSEQTPRGRTIRVTASLFGDQLTVNSTGDRGSDYRVTFAPFGGGQRLRVTRQFYVESLTSPVTSSSTYNKTSDIAQLDLYSPRDSTASAPRDSYPVPNETRLNAVLNEALSTRQSRDGDRFTLTVTSPSRFESAVIEGYVSRVERTGRVTGRSGMSLRFERIRLPNGTTAPFDGAIESVRTAGGDEIRVDNEGRASEETSQTERTLTRSGIGAALGAVIGAIAGGGKGAAIGAVVGAGAGAGSVFVQGRDDLEMQRGTEFVIRAASPSYGETGSRN